MNENNEITTSATTTVTHADDGIYKRVKIAKSAVRSVFGHINPFSDPMELVDYVWSKFTVDERVVVAAGSFTRDSDGNLAFLMPSTARVIRYIRNGIDRYEKGYTKLIISDPISTDNRFRHFRTEKFEILAESYDPSNSSDDVEDDSIEE